MDKVPRRVGHGRFYEKKTNIRMDEEEAQEEVKTGNPVKKEATIRQMKQLEPEEMKDHHKTQKKVQA